MAFLSSHDLTRRVGESVEYSNLGAGLLGYALAARAGTDYETLVRSRVLEPLAMTDTAIRTEHGREIRWHSGGTGGYRSFIGFDRNAGVGVVVLSNAARDIDDLGFHLLDRRFALAEAAQPRTAIDLDPAIYDRYVGRYQLAQGVNITVTRDGDGLFVQLTGSRDSKCFRNPRPSSSCASSTPGSRSDGTTPAPSTIWCCTRTARTSGRSDCPRGSSSVG